MIKNIRKAMNSDFNLNYVPEFLWKNNYKNYAKYSPYDNNSVILYVNLDKIHTFESEINDDYSKNGFVKLCKHENMCTWMKDCPELRRLNEMSVGFVWFKDYKICVYKGSYAFDYDRVEIEYIGGGNTSHSARNISTCQTLLRCNFNKCIPKILEDNITSESDDLGLIDPHEMSMMCEKILNGTQVDDFDLRDRFEEYKKYSDEGYYIAYYY